MINVKPCHKKFRKLYFYFSMRISNLQLSLDLLSELSKKVAYFGDFRLKEER